MGQKQSQIEALSGFRYAPSPETEVSKCAERHANSPIAAHTLASSSQRQTFS